MNVNRVYEFRFKFLEALTLNSHQCEKVSLRMCFCIWIGCAQSSHNAHCSIKFNGMQRWTEAVQYIINGGQESLQHVDKIHTHTAFSLCWNCDDYTLSVSLLWTLSDINRRPTTRYAWLIILLVCLFLDTRLYTHSTRFLFQRRTNSCYYLLLLATAMSLLFLFVRFFSFYLLIFLPLNRCQS